MGTPLCAQPGQSFSRSRKGKLRPRKLAQVATCELSAELGVEPKASTPSLTIVSFPTAAGPRNRRPECARKNQGCLGEEASQQERALTPGHCPQGCANADVALAPSAGRHGARHALVPGQLRGGRYPQPVHHETGEK